MNNTFHTSLMRLWMNSNIYTQSFINQEERRSVAGFVVEGGDDGKILDKWVFEKVLNVHDEDKSYSGFPRLIKWKYNDILFLQPKSDLKSCEKELNNFHEKNPDKPEPPL